MQYQPWKPILSKGVCPYSVFLLQMKHCAWVLFLWQRYLDNIFPLLPPLYDRLASPLCFLLSTIYSFDIVYSSWAPTGGSSSNISTQSPEENVGIERFCKPQKRWIYTFQHVNYVSYQHFYKHSILTFLPIE